ncbi:MAG: radical SAM protein [Saprospiraceae bacterium]
MTKILFTHTYFYRFDPKQWSTKQPYPPLGTLYAAALMRENGFQVALHDSNLVESEDSILPILEEEQPKYLVMYDDGFNYLTKMCLTNMRQAAFKMAKYAKQHNCTVIVCSSDSTDHFAAYLSEGVDYVIHGEGELGLLELVQQLEMGESVENIRGISYQVAGEISKNIRRPVLKDLDSLPMPAWDLVDVEPYRAIWESGSKPFTLNVATTRGCPFKCNWCAKPIYGNRYNAHSPERIADQMQYMMQQFDVQNFWMCDDIFGLKPGWVQQFRDLVQARNLHFKYKIQSRADLLLEADNIDALVASGLETVWIGAESGSQKILDAMDKGTTIEQIYESTRLLKEKGVRVAYFLQFGYPGETKEDIDRTIQMVLENMPHEIGISVSYPLPGTKFYENVKHELIQKANWTDSNDLDLMFENAYPKAFYKVLYTYVHNRHRVKRGTESLQQVASRPLALSKEHLRHIASMCYNFPKKVVNGYRMQQFQKADG